MSQWREFGKQIHQYSGNYSRTQTTATDCVHATWKKVVKEWWQLANDYGTLITMVCEHVVHKTVRSCVIRFHRQIGRFKHFFGAKATYNEKRMQHKNLLVCNLRHALNTHSHAFVVLRYFLDSMMCSVPRTRNMIHGSRNECIEKEWSGKVLVT